MNKYKFTIIIFALILDFAVFASAEESIEKYRSDKSSIRVTGDTTGVSNADILDGKSTTINGNVKGVTFSQWVTGEKQNLNSSIYLSTQEENESKLGQEKSLIDTSKVLVSGQSSPYNLEHDALGYDDEESGVLVSSSRLKEQKEELEEVVEVEELEESEDLEDLNEKFKLDEKALMKKAMEIKEAIKQLNEDANENQEKFYTKGSK